MGFVRSQGNIFIQEAHNDGKSQWQAQENRDAKKDMTFPVVQVSEQTQRVCKNKTNHQPWENKIK